MKKWIGIMAVIFLLSGLVNASNVTVELKAHYFHPSEEAFKDIYGGGMMYGGEVSIDIGSSLEIWAGGSFFSKKG